MKKEMNLSNLFKAMMFVGCFLCFTACDDDDNPATTDEPKVEDVYGDYSGKMQFAALDEGGETPSTRADEEAAGTDVTATVNNNKVTFAEFPIRDIVVSIVGEEQADAIISAVGTVSYEVEYTPTMTTAKDSVYMAMSPKPLEISIPVDEENSTTVTVEISAPDNGNYEFETGNLKMGLQADKVSLGGTEIPTIPSMSFTFDMKKK